MPNVKFVKDELRRKLKQYQLISDCIEGQEQVKFRRQAYLPQPNPGDTSKENGLRYQAYLDRAVYYNVTARTQGGLVGAVFESPPNEKLPTTLQPVIDDASGGGISLLQTAKWAVGEVLAKGRGALWTDFPQAPEGGITAADLATGKFRPTIHFYIAEQVINWRVVKKGSSDLLTLVVIQEQYTKDDDGFEERKGTQWRVLRLVNGVYTVSVYRDDSGTERPAQGPFTPTDFNGNPLEEIPFTFIGSENNDPDVDRAPMYDMATLNIAHYRNSADFEEAAYIVGQPTPWFAGLTETWVKTVLNGRVELGSRAAIPLPENGSAGLLQATETTLAFEAMQHKERQMVALGARLVQNEGTQRTLGEAKMEDASETSVLSTVADNVSDAIEWILSKSMLFVDGTEPEPKEDVFMYRLNTRYGLSNLPPEELTAILAAWTGNALTFGEMRSRLRAGGLATEDDQKAKQEIDKAIADADARETKKLNEQAEGSAKAKANNPPPRAPA